MTTTAKTILAALVLAAIGGFVWYVLLYDQPAVEEVPVVDTSSWKTYRNDAYGFELTYPAEWRIAEFPDNPVAPMFNVYIPPIASSLPLTHHHSEVNVSVFPQGIPTEGVFGVTVEGGPEIGETVVRELTYVLVDNTPWAVVASFANPPASWTGGGLIWARAAGATLSVRCLRNGVEVSEQQCDPMFGDEVVREGSVDPLVWETEQAILKSFRFLSDSEQEALVRVTQPKANDTIVSPLTVTGEARGTWYFEASFPIVLEDASGNVLVQTYGQAQGDWMTTEFVPFVSPSVSFDPGTATNGFLVVKKDNPSGLPENDAEVKIPVVFGN
jgi:hypothetical protein